MNEEQIRKDFEEWMGDGGLSPRALGRNSMGDYILMQTAHAWEVWKAAHTHYAKSAAPVVLPEPVVALYTVASRFIDWVPCTVGFARKVDGGIFEVEYAYTEQQVRELLATSGQSAETTEGATNEVTVLPDGSAFAVYSYPLPKGHWLYAPREYEQGAEEPKELAAPILTHAAREQVVSAIRYAVRAATDCGKETDFDPDALVQNAVYALCGPFNKNQPQPQADALDAERALLTVRLTSFPESNGKRNWTAQFVRAKPWKGLVGSAGGITISHGEFWNRVAYEAERARFLIGERDTEPHIRDYGTDIQTPEEWLGEGKGRAAIAAAKENK